MIMVPVESSNIAAVGYDPTAEVLCVRFKGGDEWNYLAVPRALYQRLLAAESKGSFFHSRIKGKYEAQQVAKALAVPDGSTVSKHATQDGRVGFLVETNSIESANPIKQVEGGLCPKCEAPALGFDPPLLDERYQQRIEHIKQVYKLENDKDAHIRFLRDTGGYIETCVECDTSFFVKATKARLRA